MSRYGYASLLVFSMSVTAFAVQPDKPGCTDHPLFPTRMPNYRIESCETTAFDAFQFSVASGPKRTVEGKVTRITYAVERREDDQSAVAVVRNYENALKAIGGTVAAEAQWWVNGSVVLEGREVWAEAQKGNGKIWLTIVEKQGMEQHIVADAASFANDIKTTGHVAVYGLYFDSDKAVLTPESTPALAEVAKLLQADPGLKLWVVGHTDSSGTVEHNMQLSQARADAVVTALTATHGIAAARLRGFGVGPVAPVATNATDEGKAKNRRVELVRQ